MNTLNRNIRNRFLIIITFILAITFSCSDRESVESLAEMNDSKQNNDVIPVENVYKNIQVLNGMPGKHLDGVMNFFWNALQVHCIECHMLGDNGWDFPNDEKESKRTARRMIMMVRNINKNNFSGESRITCFTCHRRSLQPVEFMYFPQNPPSFSQYNKRVEKQTTPTQSELDKRYSKVLDKNDRDGIELVKLEGVFKDDANWREQRYKIKFDATGNYLFTSEVLGDNPDTTTFGFNGDSTWIQTKSKTEKASVRRAYNVDSFIKLLDFDAAWTLVEGDIVMRTELLDTEDVVVVKRPIDKNSWEEFYISSERGYLLKRIIYTNTPVAVLTREASFSDFRNVDGILIAHEIKLETGNLFTSGILNIESVKFGENYGRTTFSPDS